MPDSRDPRPSSRSDSSSDVWARPRLVGVARDLLEHQPFAALGRSAYRAIARFAARELSRLPFVDGVYGVGSMRRADAFAPGYSDVDLYVVAELGSARRERELREALRRWLTSRSALRVIKHVDVGSVAELDRSRRFGGAWAVDLDRRFRCLAGVDRTRRSPVERPAGDVRLVEVAESLRRWTKASPNLVDAALRRDPRERSRGSMRLLADVLAAGLGADRLDPLPGLVAAARADGHLRPGDAILDDCTAIGLASDRSRLELAGDVLDRLVAELVMPGRGSRPLPRIDRTDVSLGRIADRGFAGVVTAVGQRHGGREPVFVVGRRGESTGSVLRRLVDEDVRIDGSIPVAASESLIAASFLLDPFPFASEAMCSSGCDVAVANPDRTTGRTLARARLVASPRRARGRILRLGADPAAAHEAAARELAIGHGLASALERDTPEDAALELERGDSGFDESLVRLEARIDAILDRA